MSDVAAVPTHPAVSLSAQTSALPPSSTIFGQVLLAVQRSRIPLAGKPLAASGHGTHDCGPSLPASYSFDAPSGKAKRAFSATLRPAIIGHTPSYTLRLLSS